MVLFFKEVLRQSFNIKNYNKNYQFCINFLFFSAANYLSKV